jgi:transposase
MPSWPLAFTKKHSQRLALCSMTSCKASRLAIIRAFKAGMTIKQASKVLGVSVSTVVRVRRQLFQKPTSAPQKVGRRPNTTPEMDKFIVDEYEKNRKIVPRQISALLKTKFGIHLGFTQIKGRLRKEGLFGRVCSRKPLLRPINKLKRLIWAFQHRHWTTEQWKNVLWSDEKKFELFNSKRRQYCRKRINEPLRDDLIQPSVKHGGGSLMVWGCVGNNAPGKLVKINGIMDKELYKTILDTAAMPSGSQLVSSGSWYFQADNDPKHSSKLCKSFLSEQACKGGFEIMSWPPQSPDLSPIELLWDEVDRQVQAQHPTNLPDLQRIVFSVWEALANEVVEKVVNRMPLICQAVMKAGGGLF